MQTRQALRNQTLAAALGLLVTGTACSLYTLGGPGHGARFEIPPGALQNPDPVVQSWIAYSLAKSACQLQQDGDRPSHHRSFECELRPRKILVERWAAFEGRVQDAYLDLLLRVEAADFLAEYVWVYVAHRGVDRPSDLRLDAFDVWRAEQLGFHRPQTRIIGWWS